ncbi:MAG: hypothetical protein GF375_01615, partial [Candidatus Omnitrophica bacterium]|nr:hypothetical protein [Candidatus Omnitrophota bacterium]
MPRRTPERIPERVPVPAPRRQPRREPAKVPVGLKTLCFTSLSGGQRNIDLESAIYSTFPRGADHILAQVEEVEPTEVIVEGDRGRDIVIHYLAYLIHGHGLAAFNAWRHSALASKVGKFGDKVATQALEYWYNLLPFGLRTEAAEGARDEAATVEGSYGLTRLVSEKSDIEISYANDPVEVTERLQRHFYLSCVSIASYALHELCDLFDVNIPGLSLPDRVYMFGIMGPKGSNVEIDLPRGRFVGENMRRVAKVRNSSVSELRVTGVLLRERHLGIINDALRYLGIDEDAVPEDLRQYVRTREDDSVYFTNRFSLAEAKSYVKSRLGGRLVLRNSEGGWIKLVTDGDLMPVMEIIRGTADISFGAGGVAESMIKVRMGYHYIDFQGRAVSYLGTMDGKPDAVQVTDSSARYLQIGEKKGKPIDEIALCREVGLEPLISDAGEYIIDILFDKDTISGGPYNISIVTCPLGGPQGKNDYVPELDEVQVADSGQAILVSYLVVYPSGRIEVIRVRYATPLADYQQYLENSDTLQERVAWSTLIARIYGNLKMYEEAERYLFKALEKAEIMDGPEVKRHIESIQAYYRGMKEILATRLPDITEAEILFTQAREKGFKLGQVMLEVIEYGQPQTSTSPLLDALDNVIKSANSERKEAEEKFFTTLQTADKNDIHLIRLLLIRLAAMPQDVISSQKIKDFIHRVINYALANPAFNEEVGLMISELPELRRLHQKMQEGSEPHNPKSTLISFSGGHRRSNSYYNRSQKNNNIFISTLMKALVAGAVLFTLTHFG